MIRPGRGSEQLAPKTHLSRRRTIVGQERKKGWSTTIIFACFMRELLHEFAVLLIPTLQKGRDEGLLALKVMKQTGVCHVGTKRNLPQRRAIETVLDEAVQRGVKYFLPPGSGPRASRRLP